MYPSVSKRRTVSHVRIFPPHGRGERSARRSDCRRSVASIDRQGARPGRVDHIARAAAQRARQRRLPSARGRRGVHAAPPAHGDARDGCQAHGLCHGPTGRRLDAGADRRTAAARDRARPASGLHGDNLRLDLPGRAEDGAALALPDPPPCAAKEAPRPDVSRHDRRENPPFSAIRRRRRPRDGGPLGGRPRDLQTLPPGAGTARAQDPDHADDAPGRQDRRRDHRRDDGHVPAARPQDARLIRRDNGPLDRRLILLILRQRHLLRPPHAAARHAERDNVFLRRVRELAEGRRRERQRPHPTMAAARNGPRRDQRAGYPGDRHDHQPHAAQMPRLPIPRRGVPVGAWQGRRSPLCLNRCASRWNPPTVINPRHTARLVRQKRFQTRELLYGKPEVVIGHPNGDVRGLSRRC